MESGDLSMPRRDFGCRASRPDHEPAPFIDEAQAQRRSCISTSPTNFTPKKITRPGSAFSRAWSRAGSVTPTEHFLDGIHSLCLDPHRIPRLEDVNRFLRPLTGFQAKAVSGYIPSFLFFDCLRNRIVSHHDHHSPFRPARLSARARYLSRRRRPRPHAHRPCLRGDAGALRRMRAHRGGAGSRNPRRSTNACAA